MTACILDASALLAFIFREPGADAVADWLDRGATASAVTLQEVATKLRQRGFTPEDAAEAIEVLGLEIADHTLPLALAAGNLYGATRSLGLSHGDRGCLALALAQGVPAVTSDRAWSDAAEAIGAQVHQFR